jgi:cardiolipin synthase C
MPAATLISSGLEAFALRLELAETARTSLDLQYYYWKHDLSGRLLTRAILRAADRGVKVRLLLDDMNAFGLDRTNIRLDMHENIEVRLFNPSRSRTNRLRRMLELLFKFTSATRRMHNKNWVTDRSIAIVGGRNIGDAYFDASTEANFRDLDVLLEGSPVEKAQSIFNSYWESRSAVPIRRLLRWRQPNLERLRKNLEFLAAIPEAQQLLEAARRHTLSTARNHTIKFSNSNEIEVEADPPEKAESRNSSNWLHHTIRAYLKGALHDLRIVSPYFIPGRAGLEDLAELKDRGVNIKVITNSLAATDVAAVHGAYSNYRHSLLAKGIQLFELKAMGRKARASVFGSRSASLHTKSFVVDDKVSFVGSFNLDPRSASINTEMGVFMVNEQLARALIKIFDKQKSPHASYRVELADGKLQWREPGTTSLREPSAGLMRRVIAKLVSFLPIETQL